MKPCAAYFVKNYHPAHAGIIAALETHGHDVRVVAQRAKDRIEKDGASLQQTNVLVMPSGRIFSRLFRGDPKLQIGREIPRLRPLLGFFFTNRPQLTLVYERRMTSSVVWMVARLFGSSVVQVLDSPKRPKYRRRWCGMVVRYAFSPKVRLHSGTIGQVGHAARLGPLLGTSWLAPYPIAPPHPTAPSRARSEAAPSMLKVLVMGSSNARKAELEIVVRAVHSAGLHERVSLTILAAARQAMDLEPELRRLESRFGIHESELVPGLPPGELPAFMADFDLLVYPSRGSSFGHAVAVALRNGLPVLCSDSIGAKVLIRHGVNGLIFATGSAEDLGDGLARLVGSADERDEMARNARGLAAQELSYEAWYRVMNAALAAAGRSA